MLLLNFNRAVELENQRTDHMTVNSNCMLETIVCFVFIQFLFKNNIKLHSNDLYLLTNGVQNAQKA